ncbi:MAG: hypothetical protein ACQESX_06685 [Bacteroidota bacterium]
MWKTINLTRLYRQLLLLFIGLILITMPARAQEEDQPYSEQVDIIAPYQPSIEDARKINMTPELKVQKPEKKTLEYNITPQKIPVEVELEDMQPVRFQSGVKETLKSNYIRAGGGNVKTAYGELFTTSRQSQEHRIGLHLKHLSHGGDIQDYATAQNSQNLAEVFGEKYYKNSSLYARAFYDRNTLHRYGFMPDNYTETYADDDIRQRFTTLGANIRYENLDKKRDEFDYKLNLGYYYWEDNYQSLENAVNLNFFAAQPSEMFGAIDYQSFAIEGGFNFFNSGDSLNAINTVDLNVTPFFEIENGFYRLKAGATLSAVMSDEQDTELTAFPYAEARIHMVPGYLSLSGAVSGKKVHQSFRELSSRNPFIKSDITREFTTHKIDAFGALSGNIARGVDFNIKVSYLEAENYPLFITDYSKAFENEFEIAYDDVSRLTYGGSLSVKVTDRFLLDATVRYNDYTTTSENRAWHLPELELESSVSYSPVMKMPLNFRLKATSLNGRVATDSNGNVVELDDIFDLGFEVLYEHSSSLGVFLEINNLLSQEQSLWYQYPSYGINAMAGVSYSF